MAERDFAGTRNGSATDQAGVADGVVRRAEGPRANQSARISSMPATLWIRVVSMASSSDMGGRIVGMRLASMVFPAPGGPRKMMLWLPAQETSRARLAPCWPRTSRRSDGVLRGFGEQRFARRFARA